MEDVSGTGHRLGHSGKMLVFQLHHPVFDLFQLMGHTLGGGCRLQRLGRQQIGNAAVLLPDSTGVVQGTAAAGHLNADAALEPDHTEQPDETDFSGGLHMGTAAGA